VFCFVFRDLWLRKDSESGRERNWRRGNGNTCGRIEGMGLYL